MAFQPTLSQFGVPTNTGQQANGILMPKLKYRFRVSLQGFGPATAATELTRQVATAGRPQIQHGSTPIHSYNNIMYLAQKPEWQSIEITVRDDVTNSVSILVATQLQKQMNHFTQLSPEAGINYKFFTQIETLDGGNSAPLETWYLEGCYLETVAYDQFDYSNSESMMITLTLRYDNATQDVNTIMPYNTTNSKRGSLIA
jgi:hypothetical protein